MKIATKENDLIDDAIAAIQRWVDMDPEPLQWCFRPHLPPDVRGAREAAAYALRAAKRPTRTLWRATNRPEEIDDVRRGVEIISRNHVDGTMESGMSVADGLHYACMQGYLYAYRVDGDVVGYGSDGEPTIRNVQVIGGLEETASINDPAIAYARGVVEVISQATGLDSETLSQLSCIC